MALISPIEFISKKNKKIVIRCLDISEATQLHEAIVEIAKTSPYILLTSEDWIRLGVEAQAEIIKKSNQSPKDLFIVSTHNDSIVGITNFAVFKSYKRGHRGSLGISLRKDFHNEGIATANMKVLIEHCKSIPDLEFLELNVMVRNLHAVKLYENLGFIKVSTQKNAYRFEDGTYSDDIFMSLDLR